MTIKAHRYYPDPPPEVDVDQRLLDWLNREYDSIYEDLSTSADINTLREPPIAPYNGMDRYFLHDPQAGTGWSPDTLGSGRFFYHEGFWYRIALNSGVPHDPANTDPPPSDLPATSVGASDVLLKDNIQPIKGSALDMVNGMRGCTFTWIQDNRPAVGVIAQEIEKIVPEAVLDSSHGFKAVDALGLIAVLIEAVKELNAKLEDIGHAQKI